MICKWDSLQWEDSLELIEKLDSIDKKRCKKNNHSTKMKVMILYFNIILNNFSNESVLF